MGSFSYNILICLENPSTFSVALIVLKLPFGLVPWIWLSNILNLEKPFDF